jgi:hypothetical protein
MLSNVAWIDAIDRKVLILNFFHFLLFFYYLAPGGQDTTRRFTQEDKRSQTPRRLPATKGSLTNEMFLFAVICSTAAFTAIVTRTPKNRSFLRFSSPSFFKFGVRATTSKTLAFRSVSSEHLLSLIRAHAALHMTIIKFHNDWLA